MAARDEGAHGDGRPGSVARGDTRRWGGRGCGCAASGLSAVAGRGAPVWCSWGYESCLWPREELRKSDVTPLS